ncbi:hypothetical protein NNO92_17065 [Acinetobacter baumannii]|uniref:hypothetical protein n=1 Tax=Acinetobacter baumannii TaxID=470 RepID=UPI0020CDD38E|nr:hypothetical protein [Acinetobacter baumannii]MCQ1100067.1 hypothetical protein [Acinetobacter baumannii]
MKYSIILILCMAFPLVGCGEKNPNHEGKKIEEMTPQEIKQKNKAEGTSDEYKGENW